MPSTIVSDRDAELMSYLLRTLWDKLGTKSYCGGCRGTSGAAAPHTLSPLWAKFSGSRSSEAHCSPTQNPSEPYSQPPSRPVERPLPLLARRYSTRESPSCVVRRPLEAHLRRASATRRRRPARLDGSVLHPPSVRHAALLPPFLIGTVTL
jgi:hypothetical protein